MKVIQETPVPFSERTFNVVLTGLELAIIRCLVANLYDNPNTVGEVSNSLFKSNPCKHLIGLAGADDYGVFSDIPLDEFVTEVNSKNP